MSEQTTTECLYYMAFRSFLLQDPKFQLNFDMLSDQFKRFPQTFRQFSKKEVLRLVQMEEAFRTGTFNLFKGSTENFSKMVLPKMESTTQNHKDLVKAIYDSRETSLIPFIGPIDSADPEYPTMYGPIDLRVIGGKCAHVVEFKTDTANHSIVGQVMKYYVALSLQFQLKFFDEVKIVTICTGYDQASLNGLKQIGATTLLVNPTTLKVSKLL